MISNAVHSMPPPEQDACSLVSELLQMVTSTQGATQPVKENLCGTFAAMLFPDMETRKRQHLMEEMVRQFKEVFASASRSSPAKLDCLSCLSSPESSSVFDGLMSFAVDSLFGVGEMPTFTTMLQLSPNAARERPVASAAGVGAVHASRASAAMEREQCSRVERAAPSSENDGLVPAWVIDTLRNEKVGARVNRKALIRACKQLRNEIHIFEAQFSEKHSRAPAPGSERQPIAPKYEVYRSLKKFVRANAATRIEAVYRGYRGRKRAASALRQKEAQREMESTGLDLQTSYLAPLADRRPVASEGPSVVYGSIGAASVPSVNAEDQVQGYLEAAEARLRTDQVSHRRPESINNMSLAQKEQEKSFVKHELKRFDDLLTSSLGRPLRKADKEPMRPLYSRYHELKKAITEHQALGDTATWEPRVLQDHSNSAAEPVAISKEAYSKPAVQEPVVTGVADDRLMMTEKYNQIKAQKRSLQQKLHQYESEFYKKHGRKMKHHEDIAPVQQEYTEYKRLKALVVQLEEEGFGR